VPSRSWQQRVEDILSAIADIQAWTVGKTQAELASDQILLRAILYSFMIIGEAASNVPENLQDVYTEIPWRLMKDMRNVMAHEYFQIDVQILWNTITKSLPRVVTQLETLLEREIGRE
jgi:uncharacterized protein with HEPN domain